MNQHLQKIFDFIQQDEKLTAEEKALLTKAAKSTDSDLSISEFKLDRTEKVKRTTAILLEETIEELEQKRKAVEAHNKELEIETALERVRTVAMSMMKPDDLLEISKIQFNEFKQLGFTSIRNALIGIFDDCREYFTDYDYSDFSGGAIAKIPYYQNKLVDNAIRRMKSSNDAFTEFIVEGDELEEWKTFRKANGEYDDTRITNTERLYYYFYSIESGNIGISTFEKITEEQLNILKRFRNVFDLAYKRYVDISKAAAQAREAQIEVAVERVRAQSMAMHQTTDLDKVNKELYNQLQWLKVESLTGVSIYFFDEEGEVKVFDLSSPGKIGDPNSYSFKFSSKKYPVLGELWQHFKKSEDYFALEYPLEKLQAAIPEFKEIDMVMANAIEEAINSGSLTHQWNAFGRISNGLLGIDLMLPPSEDTKTIVLKMSAAFNLAYQRFLDLQKAEAQSREAQIQLALERARSQSMIMQHSKELDDTLRVFHEQVLLLNIPSAFSFLWLPDEAKDKHIFWAAWKEFENNSTVFKSKAINYPLDRNEPATAQCLIDWKGTDPIVSYHVQPSGVRNYFAAWHELINGVDHLKPEYFSEGLYYVEAFMKYGCFGVMVATDLTEIEKNILGRFAIEFERTYRRFLDLQKAEAQAREAQIEASLERVRAKAMSMHKSEDLHAAVAIVFEELEKLDIGVLRCGISVLNKEKRCGKVWLTSTDQGQAVQVTGDEPFDIHPLLQGAFEAWLQQEDFYYELNGEDLGNYYKAVNSAEFMLPESQLLISATNIKQYCFVAVYNSGGLFAFQEAAFTEEAKKIMRRFASVFDLTYKRFLDLQKAEAQVREAQIETALERVRSRTLAMQKSDELAETAAVLFQQLIILGIEPNRLYISILQDELGKTEFWITDEDGTKVSSAFETNLNDNPTFKKMFDGWKQERKSLVIDMQGDELQEYFKYLSSVHVPFKGGLTQKRRVQDIAYFSKGFIGMASPEEQPAETLQLLERFAYTFNLTFTRFSDLKLAEAQAIQAEEDLIKLQTEKKRAEDALTELRATQTQLIQSEKMASLGELTAGIAHEIQNPLNFVNNFSEVSIELIMEMVDEAEKGNTKEVKAIVDDIIQNLEKINHHGKRADAIVKGMLQHSRTTSATKEQTDINKLADEYLRLAYHGIRAKDKSFNATLKTDYDESIGNISIIPQDIGRVILNLLTNAFYAVAEKKKQKSLRTSEGETSASRNEVYEAIVTVTTRRLSRPSGGWGAEITVTDNGNGIPSSVKEKIFQPFFTTKPTGQGTGLGLSLAYDIVKVHGGELMVETKEKEGSIFKITLPA